VTVTRARLAKLEARHNPRRGSLALHDVGTGELHELAENPDGNGRRWAQRRGESLAAMGARIEADTGVQWLVLFLRTECPADEDHKMVQVLHARGSRAQVYIPDNGRDR